MTTPRGGDPPRPNDDEAEDGLDPEELDFTQHESVENLGEGRYLIETDGPMASAGEAITESNIGDEDGAEIPTVYAVHANLIADENQREVEVTSDDVVEAFDQLLAEFAETVSSDIPVEDTLALLAKESEYVD